MIDLLREADPDVVITHALNDYHPDHRYVSQLVFDSYLQKGLPHLPDQAQPACRFGQTQVYYMDKGYFLWKTQVLMYGFWIFGVNQIRIMKL